MPIVVRGGKNARAINQLLQMAQIWIFPNTSPKGKEQLIAHLEWMRQQQDDLVVACRFETNSTRRTTTIHFEVSFVQQWQPNGRS
jgi:hypothetical protein